MVSWTSNALATTKTHTGLSLTPGQYYYYSVQSEDGAGLVSPVGTSDGQLVLMATGIDDADNGTNLIAYPNPFSESTTIAYSLETNAKIKITLCDVLGKELVILPEQEQAGGAHRVMIGKAEYELAKGIYLLKLDIDKKQLITKLIIQ